MISRKGRLTKAEAYDIITQLAKALDYVHSQNRLHLDIKPANVLMRGGKEVVLIDFGLSKHYLESGGQTSSTPVGVSHGYAPPEQYRQDGLSEFKPPTDIYSLGATLYKMVTGIKLPESLRISDEGMEILDIPSYVDSNLRSVIMKAMQPKRRDRPQSIAEFLALLDGGSDVTEITGSIRVQCSPAGAEILIDGKSVGIAPLKISGISAGRHQVEVRASGYESRSWTVDVSAGVTSEVKGSLTAKPVPAPPTPPPDPHPHRSTLLAILVGALVAVIAGVCVYLAKQRSVGGGDNQDTEDSIAVVTPDTPEEHSEGISDVILMAVTEELLEEVQTGSIAVSCGPKGATIKVDGKSYGTTPKEIEGLSVGRHTVEVSKSGYESRSWTVTVKANGTEYLSEDLAESTGSIRVNCKPDGSTIKVDGKSVGTTPSTISDLSVGSHTVEVSKSSYESLSRTVTVRANATESVSGNLTEKKSTIQTTNQTSTAASGTINGHDYVDLGLSVKWATCNVGASKPSDYGNYYAWGETKTKSAYTEDNSKTYGKSSYNYDIGGKSSTDAARANWGGTWRLPTKAEFQELIDKCKWTWTTQGGHNGYRVTGPNGNSIFLPAAGYRGGSLSSDGSYGSYWTSSPDESNSDGAYDLGFGSGGHSVYYGSRYWGRTVRPVSE